MFGGERSSNVRPELRVNFGRVGMCHDDRKKTMLEIDVSAKKKG